ncbi:MAG: NAD(P)-dependent oxidoreductase [Pseudomonadota bacterium]|nr:NAD(P)-dependent oxidoreductase [Pseudomonadota bacterium]
MTAQPKIAFLGIGLMGNHMARNLLKAGYALNAWNRTISKAEALAVDGAEIARTPADAVKDADYVITMLSDGPTVRDMFFTNGLCQQMKAGACLIDMSSIKASEAREHSAEMRATGRNHLDAPVSGGTKGAEAGSLAIMVGGAEDVFAKAKPVFTPMGRPVRVGPDGSGQLSKLANQTSVAVTIGVVAEAMLLAEKGGANPAAIRDALKGGFADSVILQQHGERMTTGNFEPGGLTKFQLKDINNALEEAGHHGLTLPLTEQIQQRYDVLTNEMDGADTDHSAIYLELLRQNNL